MGSAVHQFVSLGGQSLGSSQSVGSALETTESGVQLGVAQKAALGISGGDGFVTIVDYTDSDVIYCEYQYGNLFKSVNGGFSFFSAMDGIDGADRSNWNTPFVSPRARRAKVWRSSRGNF